jgi:GDPmannose 4,6-dehydratase
MIAFITGVTGQDGSCLAELLLHKRYAVPDIKSSSSLFNTGRIDHLYQNPHVTVRKFILHRDDMTDSTNLVRSIRTVLPDEIYSLAAQNHGAGISAGNGSGGLNGCQATRDGKKSLLQRIRPPRIA